MGTRGAWGFRVDGEDKISYNHWDSYPTGLGNDLVKALNVYLSDHSTDDLATVARRVQMVAEAATPDSADMERYKHFHDEGVSSGEDWYSLLRITQGKPEYALQGAVDHLAGAASFLGDSLWCEWAYIINVDDGVLEVYEGGNKNPNALGRYANVGSDNNGYAGVKLIATYSFGEIPSSLARLETDEDG